MVVKICGLQQRYFWEEEHHESVVKSYRKQLRDMIKNVISKAKRDMKKPLFLDEDHWEVMLQFWQAPAAKKRSQNCSAARKSPRFGYGEHCHTVGSKSFNKIALEMTEENEMSTPIRDGEEPEPGIQEESVATPTPEMLNKAYIEHVPVKKGYRFGLCALQHHKGESNPVTASSSRQLHMETEVQELKTTVNNLRSKLDTLQASLDLILSISKDAPPTTQEEQPKQQRCDGLDFSVDDYMNSS